MCAKADYHYGMVEGEIQLLGLLLTICLFIAGLAALAVYFITLPQASVAPELPEYKIEPQTTITARP